MTEKQITAKVIADSLAPCGARLTTMVWKVPRSIQAEINTHKMLSKSSASSRAIPQPTMIKRVQDNPFVPRVWGINQAGMQAHACLEGADAEDAADEWLRIRDVVISKAVGFQQRFNLHKQVVNRLTEPWMMTEIIISGTDWDNMLALRDHEKAEPHFHEVAHKARLARDASTPRELAAGEWHLPFIDDEDVQPLRDYIHPHREYHNNVSTLAKAARELAVKVSMARCARVSYLNHEGKRDVDSDLALYEKLVGADPKHAAPSEHVACALTWPKWWVDRCGTPFATVYDLRNTVVKARESRRRHALGQLARDIPTEGAAFDEACLGDLTSGNFIGFQQYRKTLPNENIGGLMP